MEDARAEVASLRADFNAQALRQTERHTENKDMLREIRDDVKRINGNIGRHDERIKVLERRLLPSEESALSRATVRWWIWIATGSVGATIGALKLMGKL